MGNKSGKFNVPANTTDATKGDAAPVDEVVNNVDESHKTESNGDQIITAEVTNTEEAAQTAAPKKKSVISWLKKVSIRKEKKPKTPKQNGVKEDAVEAGKEDAVEAGKENGDVVEEMKAAEVPDTTVEVAVANGHCDDDEEVKETVTEKVATDDVAEEVPCSNGHVENNHVDEVAAESPTEEQQQQ